MKWVAMGGELVGGGRVCGSSYMIVGSGGLSMAEWE